MRVLCINCYRANKILFACTFENVRKEATFFSYFRISTDFFEKLYHTTIYFIKIYDRNMRKYKTPKERLFRAQYFVSSPHGGCLPFESSHKSE